MPLSREQHKRVLMHALSAFERIIQGEDAKTVVQQSGIQTLIADAQATLKDENTTPHPGELPPVSYRRS